MIEKGAAASRPLLVCNAHVTLSGVGATARRDDHTRGVQRIVQRYPAHGAAPARRFIVGNRKSLARRVGFAAAIAILVLALAPAALAAKGKPGGGGKGGGGTGTGSGLTLALVADTNQDGLPNWGDTITFSVTTTATTEPHVNVSCSRGGVVVYGAATGYYASYPWPWTQNMTLSSEAWTGGAAACTAVLSAYSGTSVTTLGTLTFQVGA